MARHFSMHSIGASHDSIGCRLYRSPLHALSGQSPNRPTTQIRVIIYLTHLAVADLLVGMSKKKVRGNGAFPETLHEAIRYFADEDRTLEFMKTIRWPDGEVRCPRCHHKDVSFISTRKVWKCKADKKQFSIKVGTVMEDSPISLDKWLCAFWLIANAKNGISSYELHRSLGVTQKTAWFLLHRIRLAMQDGSFEKMKGKVEADETFVGGLARNMHKGKRRARGTGICRENRCHWTFGAQHCRPNFSRPL
jgi:transposase-like protein